MTLPSDPRGFLYRDTLDPGTAIKLTAEALGQAEDGELYLQYRKTEAFGFDDGRLKTASYDTQSGFGLRAVSGETTAFAHANEITPQAIRRAAETMALIDPATGPSAAPPRKNNRHLYTDQDPLDLVPFADKVNLCQTIDAAARARDPRVAQVSVGLTGQWSVVEIVRPDGFVATDVRPLVRLNVAIVVEANGRRETGSFGMGGRTLYDHLFEPGTWNRAVDEALRQALVNLDAVDAPAGEMTVLCGPGWPGVLLHEAVGHGLEGDFNRKGTSAFSGRIGERVAAAGVTVVDDGSIGQRRGSLSIDDEGTPTQENILIEDGVLKGYLQDRLNARLMGVAPTGNGRRESFQHAPMPRMTNTFMRGGGDDPAELLSRVKKGVFARSFGGGQVDIVSGKFVFSCTEAYAIENGRLGAPIKGATLIGDGPNVLTRVVGIGNDFALDEGIGMCGKAGQSVPAGVGQPTLLIEGLTVGGNGDVTGWPELDWAAWHETALHLQLMTQIVGKVRLALTPWLNHGWHVALYVTPRGLTTSPIPSGAGPFEIDFDLRGHALRIATANALRTVPLGAGTVADFHGAVMAALADLGIAVRIATLPNEIPDPVRFPDDHLPRPYDRAAVEAFHAALCRVDQVFKRYRTGFLGKASPVHFFWGSFDLAVTRFSGRVAPRHPGGFPGLPDAVTCEAYSHEEASAGFWPGSDAFPKAAFYAYGYPAPEGYAEATIPAPAYYDATLGEWLLDYDQIRAAPDPESMLAEFLQSTYAAAADLGHWDRRALECEPGIPRKPRAV